MKYSEEAILLKKRVKRAMILLQAAAEFIENNYLEEYTVFYDSADCDGGCLANECRDLVEELKNEINSK